jgi:hypothetical protein
MWVQMPASALPSGYFPKPAHTDEASLPLFPPRTVSLQGCETRSQVSPCVGKLGVEIMRRSQRDESNAEAFRSHRIEDGLDSFPQLLSHKWRAARTAGRAAPTEVIDGNNRATGPIPLAPEDRVRLPVIVAAASHGEATSGDAIAHASHDQQMAKIIHQLPPTLPRVSWKRRRLLPRRGSRGRKSNPVWPRAAQAIEHKPGARRLLCCRTHTSLRNFCGARLSFGMLAFIC